MKSHIEILLEERIATFRRPVTTEKLDRDVEPEELQDTELKHL